jgi:gamma-glutamyltranspeptidase
VGARESSVAAGLAIFENGGNAVDDAVAAALFAGVVEPAETSLAGSGFLLVRDPRSGHGISSTATTSARPTTWNGGASKVSTRSSTRVYAGGLGCHSP